MEKLLNRFGLGQRIIALALAPLAVTVLFAIFQIADSKTTANQAHKLDVLAQYAPYVSGVVHELQKERGASAGFIGSSGGSQQKTTLSGQRKKTDAAIGSFAKVNADFPREDYGKDFSALVNEAQSSLAELRAVRAEISDLERTVPQMAAYYTDTIAHLLDIIKSAALLTDDADISRKITAYIALLEAKERAGQERAVGNGGFSRGSFNAASLKRFAELIEAQKSFLTVFNTYASPQLKKFYGKTVAGQSVDNVDAMRSHIFDRSGVVDDGTYSNSFWFKEITNKINLLKEVEDKANQEITLATQNLSSSASAIFWSLLVAVLVGAVLILGMSYFVFRSVASPLAGIDGAMRELSAGNLEIAVPYTEYGSSIGQMARSVEEFKQNAHETRRLQQEAEENRLARMKEDEERRQKEEAEEAARRQREAEAEERAQQERKKAQLELAGVFEESVLGVMQNVASAASQLESLAGQMNTAARTTQQEASNASVATGQAGASVQTVAAAAEEMSTSIDEISRQVTSASSISTNAVDTASNAEKRVEELANASLKIGEIVKLIDDIAGQTNLLALNATIESARAGEMGKGFAVVANEVKSLAQQTAQATSEIAEQIKEMQSITTGAVEAVRTINKTISEINEISTSLASTIEEQSATTREISRSAVEAATGTEGAVSSVTNVTTMAKDTGEAADGVLDASSMLSQNAEVLQTEVNRFLASIREG
ncbi:nitrate- and nitrite sensing domain-containing protein [Emcibacter sp.]|uniref:nitrate- and nitrite sensing domain-containing protein n=1 Tax=Emcibacter sp. TaxID=1979954 RepID=UPI002AA65A34|nr:nitrate- and nitrite sensing domain-containing protein [Emcibacter sp.]